jgi:hypothetical protein
MSSDNGGIIGVVNDPTSTTASGVWQQEEQYEAKVNDTWPQRALFTTKSCRFNSGSSDYLNRTPSSAGNRKTFTFSFWFKRSTITSLQRIFSSGTGVNDEFFYGFRADDTLELYDYQSATKLHLITNRKFRDPLAWYHIVVSVDTTQGTSSNRTKLYINGVQETSFGTETYPSQNDDFIINKNQEINIGRTKTSGSQYIDGYITETVLIDGQALDPTSFGVTNSDGVWTPIPYSGTFGTNGFNLQFEDASSLGTDSSPNGNTFTVNNLTSIDQSTDYPVVNYATWNPLFRKGTTTPAFAEGNLQSTFDDGGANEFALTTFGASSGKWYTEVKWVSATGTGATSTGILDMGYSGTADPNNAVTNTFAYFGSGQKNVSGTASSYGASYTSGDIISIALNCDDNQVTFYKNGASQGVISIIAGVTYGFMTSDYNNKVCQLNTGNPPYSISSGNADGNGYGNFEYAVPSGYYALNTANLAEFG